MAKFEIEKRPRKVVMVSRPPKENVANMLENIYQILGNQTRLLKNRALIEELDGKDAAKLLKYTQTLQLLTQEEDKHTASYALETYSDADLAQLHASIQSDDD